MEGKLTAVVKSHREHLLFIMCVRSPTFKNVLKEQFTKKSGIKFITSINNWLITSINNGLILLYTHIKDVHLKIFTLKWLFCLFPFKTVWCYFFSTCPPIHTFVCCINSFIEKCTFFAQLLLFIQQFNSTMKNIPFSIFLVPLYNCDKYFKESSMNHWCINQVARFHQTRHCGLLREPGTQVWFLCVVYCVSGLSYLHKSTSQLCIFNIESLSADM